MQYQQYTKSAFLHSIHREARINRVADGLRQVDPDIMAAYWARHDASNAMFDELHTLIREGKVIDHKAWLAEAREDLPQEVCLQCETVLDVTRDAHDSLICPTVEAEIIAEFERLGSYKGEDHGGADMDNPIEF